MFKNIDKRITYALLTGAVCLLAGAAAQSYFSSQSKVDLIDEDLEKLGPFKRDASGYIHFDYFIKLFEISSFHAKNDFAKRKQDYVTQRRLKRIYDDKLAYKKIVVKMLSEEEKVITEKLDELVAKAGIDEHEFKKNVKYHSQDNYKTQKIIQVQKNMRLSEEGQVLDKQKVLKAFIAQQEIQYKQMEKLYKEMSELSNNDSKTKSEQTQMEMALNGMTEHALGQDQLFEETGLEEEQLMYSIQNLKLEQDPEFIDIQSKANAKAMQLAQKAQKEGAMSLF